MRSYIAHRFITMLATDKSPGLVKMYPALLSLRPELRPFEAIDPRKVIVRPEDLYPDFYAEHRNSGLPPYLAYNFDEVRKAEAPEALETVYLLIVSILRNLVPILLNGPAEEESWGLFVESKLAFPSYEALSRIDRTLDVLSSDKRFSGVHKILIKALDSYEIYAELVSYWSEKLPVPGERDYKACTSLCSSLTEYVSDKILFHENTAYESAASTLGLAVSYMLRLVPYNRAEEFRSELDSIVYGMARSSAANRNLSLKSFLDSAGIAVDISGTGNLDFADRIEKILKECMRDVAELVGADQDEDFSPASVEKAIYAATKIGNIEAVLARVSSAISDCIALVRG